MSINSFLPGGVRRREREWAKLSQGVAYYVKFGETLEEIVDSPLLTNDFAWYMYIIRRWRRKEEAFEGGKQMDSPRQDWERIIDCACLRPPRI